MSRRVSLGYDVMWFFQAFLFLSGLDMAVL